MSQLDRFISLVESIRARAPEQEIRISCGRETSPAPTGIGDALRKLHGAHPTGPIEVGMRSPDRAVVLSLCGEEILESSWNRDAGAGSGGGRALPERLPEELAREVLANLNWKPLEREAGVA